VYEYYFVGQRAARGEDAGTAATEYVFGATVDRHAYYAISVFLRLDALEAWAASHGRSLSDAEQYAAAKLRLFQGFDELEDLASGSRRLAIAAGDLEDMLASLEL
jgi:hypothetical protein